MAAQFTILCARPNQSVFEHVVTIRRVAIRISRGSAAGHEFLLVTQNVDDLHERAGVSPEKRVQIHGDIFVTRCSRCDFGFIERTEEQQKIPTCTKCAALMRPGVVWFGEQLPWNEVQRVENFLNRGACDLVIVAGTTATFGYIIDWALRASRDGGELTEVNPEETPLSQFAIRLMREPAAIALPHLVDQFISQTKLP